MGGERTRTRHSPGAELWKRWGVFHAFPARRSVIRRCLRRLSTLPQRSSNEGKKILDQLIADGMAGWAASTV